MNPVRGVRRLRQLTALASVILTAAAVANELSKPELERTWHGHVLGMVPYDFRPPTLDRIRRAYWNTTDDRLFTDRVFGVGWTINLYRASVLLERGFAMLMGGAVIRPALGSRRSA